MPVVEATLSIHRSVGDTFAFCQDLANHVAIQPAGWTSYQLTTPMSLGVGVGAHFQMVVSGNVMPVDLVIIERDPQRRLVEQCYGPLEHVRTWNFEPIVDRTRVRLSLEYVPRQGFWPSLTDKLVIQPALRRSLEAYLANLKAVLERGRGMA